MTTPAFNHLISINASSLSLSHHLTELEQVATDLRNERTLAAPQAHRGPNRFRLAIGRALLQAGSVLVASPNRRTIQAR